MNARLLLLLAAATGVSTLSAQKLYHTQAYGDMQVDTLYHVTIGPGTTETRATLKFSTSGNPGDALNATATFNYLELDLTNPYLTTKVARAGHTTADVKKNVKVIMADNTKYGQHYFAGVNGDFFGSTTCGLCIADGEFISGPVGMSNGTLTNNLVIDKDGKPTIATSVECGGVVPGYNVYEGNFGTATYPGGKTDATVRLNNQRWADYLVAFNDYFIPEGKPQGTTGTNAWGVEAALEPLSGTVTPFGNEASYKVTKITKSGSGGNMAIPAHGLVLSGNGAATANLDLLKNGDVVKLDFPFMADGVSISAREVIGGYPRLVTGGIPLPAVASDAPTDLGLSSRRARTAVGYNADRTRMYIFVVQEGTGRNDGLTAKALGNLMNAIGCHEALNLDGGGSSLLYVENLGNRNAVQGVVDGYTRPVMNGFFAVSTAPDDGKVARIEFVDKALSIKPGRGYQPVIYAYNKYGALISKGLHNYTLSASAATFDSSNRKMIAPDAGYFALTATYEGCTASIPVMVDAYGSNGSDPTEAPTFSGDEFVEILKDPNAKPDEPENKIYADLVDVTPDGLDWNRYEAGTQIKLAPMPTSTTSGTWTLPGATYTQEAMDADGYVIAFHQPGVALNSQFIDNFRAGFTIQDLGGEIGKCMVYNQQFGPGANVKGWPFATAYGPMQLTFYSNAATTQKGADVKKPVRVRLVMQVLHRGRHAQPQQQISSIYTSGTNYASTWALSHNGVGDNETGAKFPIEGNMFYRWVGEGSTIATIPAEKTFVDGIGTPEPWDADNTNNPYIINPDRFLVYEFDVYSAAAGPIGVHINFTEARYNTIIFKEVKFFNITNGEEIATQPRAAAAPARANAFKTNTAYGSLAGTRALSYRYYTSDGVKEFDQTPSAGIDEVSTDNAPAEYYNLQGVRVDNPTHGLYIRRQGNKTEKIIL